MKAANYTYAFRMITIVMLFFMVSSFDDPQRKAVGRWKSGAEAEPFSMDLVFYENHQFSMTMMGETMNGNWHIEFDRKLCRLMITDEGQRITVELYQFSIRGDTMSFTSSKTDSKYLMMLTRIR